MKTRISSSWAVTITFTMIFACAATAQDAATETVVPTLSYGVAPVLEMAQARVADDLIVRYVQNSGTIFALKASEIVYLKQQGVSDLVLNAMLYQRERLTGSTEPGISPAAATVADSSAETATPASSPTIVFQPVALPVMAYSAPVISPSVYVIPDTQTARYNGSSGGYPYGPHYYYPRTGNGVGWSYCYPSVSVVHIGTHYWTGSSHVHLRH